MVNSYSLKLTELESGKDNSVSQVVVFLFAVKLLPTGMKSLWTLMKSSTTMHHLLKLFCHPPSIKLLMMNHGDSENSNSTTKRNRSALSSTLIAITRELHSNSAENLRISEEIMFPQ